MFGVYLIVRVTEGKVLLMGGQGCGVGQSGQLLMPTSGGALIWTVD